MLEKTTSLSDLNNYSDISSKGWLNYQSDIALSQHCQDSFYDLAEDNYAIGSNRSRRFSQYQARFLIKDWYFEALPHRPFVQSNKHNPLSGGLLREFEPIEYDFSAYLNEAMHHLNIDKNRKY